jgi:hypothetical protein
MPPYDDVFCREPFSSDGLKRLGGELWPERFPYQTNEVYRCRTICASQAALGKQNKNYTH